MRTASKWRKKTSSFTAIAAVAALGSAGILAAAPAPSHAAAEPAPHVVTPNPAYQGPAFEGWGTSLVWFANATGGYPDEIREELFDLVFGEDGLNLNVARYNIGGGNASDVPDYLRHGAAVEGWWKADQDDSDGVTSNYADRDAYLADWDADDDASYNWDADATQRWWVEKLASTRDDMVWEAFSNSPPYFMTESGFTTGNFKSSDKQLRSDHDAPQKFTTYLTKVTEYLEDEYGIDFKTVDPFNEPCNGYWGTAALGEDGWPTGGGTTQEGAQICPGSEVNDQQSVINLLAQSLAVSGTDAVISANDETNPGQFVNAWKQYDEATRAQVGQINVHTYGTNGRLQARDFAKTSDTEMWMSEVGGDFVGTGFDSTTITGGLGMAQHIADDLRELEPNAWVFWQEVEDFYNMEKVENLNWGSIFIDFDCNEPGTEGYSVRRLADEGWTVGDPLPAAAECKIVTNSKFNTTRNYTHFINPGDHIVPTSNRQSTAAVSADGTGTTIVHVNDSAATRKVELDLSKFGSISSGATVTPVTTTEITDPEHPELNALVTGDAVELTPGATSVTLEVPAQSVTTFVIDGVSGVADDALPISDGDSYQLVGVGSGRALTANEDGLSIRDLGTTSADISAQIWTFNELPASENSHALRYVLTTADDRVLAATTAGPEFRDISIADAAADPASWWTLNTTDGSTWSLVNGGISQALDVAGQGTADGTEVGVYGSGGGSNQRWAVRDTRLVSVPDVALATIAGVAPTLPPAVTPVYGHGSGVAVPVTWDEPGAETWSAPGTVTVLGHGTDLFGNPFEVRAIVDVGGFTSADPVSVTTYAGVDLETVRRLAPTTVPAQIGASEQRFDAAVTWDWTGLTDESFASEGTVSVSGEAESNDPDGDAVAAELTVILTAATERNVTPDVSSAEASSTESGYPIDRTYNLSTTDKGWSNWVSSNKPEVSTLTYNFDSPQEVTHVTTYFYRDGTSSWADTMTVDYYDGTTWTSVPAEGFNVVDPADGSAPIVDIELGGVQASSIRVTLNAHSETHMIVSEVEIYAVVASEASLADLGALRVNGEAVAGFDSETTEYEVTTLGSTYPRISAVPRDSDADVTITQASEETNGIATIEVTAADGVITKSYSVAVTRQADLMSVTVAGEPRAGRTVTASVVVDPQDADVEYVWSLDAEVIADATSDTLELTSDAVGKSLTVTAVASRDGFTDSANTTSEPVEVLAEQVTDPDPEPTPDPTDPSPEPTEPGGEPSDPGQTPPADGSGSDAQPSDPTTAPGGSPDDALATTGSQVLPLVVLVVLMLGVGSALIAHRRRTIEG